MSQNKPWRKIRFLQEIRFHQFPDFTRWQAHCRHGAGNQPGFGDAGSDRRLTDAAVAIGHGELDTTVDIRGRDEVARLADRFNAMVTELLRQAI